MASLFEGVFYPGKLTCRFQVTRDQNIGEWLNARYKDPSAFASAIRSIVMSRAYGPTEAPPPTPVRIAPNATLNELYVELDQLDFSRQAKHGCCLA